MDSACNKFVKNCGLNFHQAPRIFYCCMFASVLKSLDQLLSNKMLSVMLIGAAIEQGSSTPLMEAAQEGHVDLVKFLLEQGT